MPWKIHTSASEYSIRIGSRGFCTDRRPQCPFYRASAVLSTIHKHHSKTHWQIEEKHPPAWRATDMLTSLTSLLRRCMSSLELRSYLQGNIKPMAGNTQSNTSFSAGLSDPSMRQTCPSFAPCVHSTPSWQASVRMEAHGCVP